MTQDVLPAVVSGDQNDAESANLIVNRHHQVIDLHPSIETIMAWPKSDLIGHLLEELIHPGDLTALQPLLSSAAPETDARAISIRLQHAVEGWVWVSLTETASDISGQRQFDVMLQPKPEVNPANEPTSELVDDLTTLISAQSQVLVFDKSNYYLWSSTGFTTAFSAEHQDLQGASLSEICNRFLLVETAADNAEINPTRLSSDAGWQGNVTTTVEGKLKPFHLNSQRKSLIKTQRGVLVLTFSALKTQEVESKALPLDVFTAVRDIAHEFRNVFGVISGHTELMRSNPSANQGNSINQLSRYSRKAIDLLESLTLLGYLDDDRATHFNPMSHVNTLDPLLRLIAGDRLALHRQENLADFECFGRPANFDHALLATIRTATRLTTASGPIQIDFSSAYNFLTVIFKLENVDSDRLQTPRNSADVIQDPETRLLEQFDALSALGAEYRVTPSLEFDTGRLSLMLSLPGERQPIHTHEPDVLVERAIKQALLIEDDPGVRDLVELFLGSLGMDVTSCSAEQEVLQLPNYDFDIIVSDVMLASGKTGPDLVRGIRSKRPEIPCLFISGYKHGALSNEDLTHPKTDFLAKPFSKNDFGKRVQALIALR
ncbi:MAG: response regulator [Gammaproteobacteria bacterium]|jgi:CheY-like chemotaxis protein|nr:response regulator [Gammaproteobacteria bacterium]